MYQKEQNKNLLLSLAWWPGSSEELSMRNSGNYEMLYETMKQT